MSGARDDGVERALGRRVVIGVCATVAAVSLVVVALFVCLDLDWLPGVANVTDVEVLLAVVLSAQVLGVAGLAWLVAAIVALLRPRLRTWWLAAAPLVLVLGAGLVLTISVLYPQDLDSSRPELDALVSEARGHPTGWTENYGVSTPRRVGRIDLERITVRGGEVELVDADSVIGDDTGWIHSPGGLPAPRPETTVEHLDGPWYLFSRHW